MSTGVPYLDVLYNPVTGCRPDFQCWGKCWARNLAHRFNQMGTPAGDFIPTFHFDKLAQPLHWRKPRRVGVCFTGDLFVDGITDEQIAAVYNVMATTPRHTYFMLTKRAKRMREWYEWVAKFRRYAGQVGRRVPESLGGVAWPLPNVYLGVSVSTQADADKRIPLLIQSPAACKWISAEPLLEEIDIYPSLRHADCADQDKEFVSWVVAAGESGPKARPLELAHVRSLRDQCFAADVPFVFKDQTSYPLLDGKRYDEMPREPK